LLSSFKKFVFIIQLYKGDYLLRDNKNKEK